MVDVACQFVVQNTKTDRQVKHQPKVNDGFKQTVKTPLSVGLPLVIHSRVRDKNLVKTLSDVFIGMVSGFNEGRVVFDRYLESSLKNKTRQKRSTTSVEFKIHVQPEMSLAMSIKDFLSSSKSKSMLVTLFVNGLLARFSSNTAIKLVVAYDNKIRSLDCEEEHTHEEADTLIPNQVLRSIDGHLSQEICVSSPDTDHDVLVLLLDLVSRGLMET